MGVWCERGRRWRDTRTHRMRQGDKGSAIMSEEFKKWQVPTSSIRCFIVLPLCTEEMDIHVCTHLH